MLGGSGFVPWKSLRHPQLGDVEVGGWRRWYRRIPPGWMLEDTCYRNCVFTLYHADAMPRVTLGTPVVERIPDAPGIFQVRVRCRNEGFMPTASGMAKRIEEAIGDVVHIAGEGIRPLARGLRRPPFGLDTPKPQPAPRANRVNLGNLRGREELEAVWLVSGRGPFRIELVSQKGGRAHVNGQTP